MSRRERDEFGDHFWNEEEEYGGGFMDIASKVFAKVTGKAAQEIGKKALSAAVTKGSEKVGSKLGDIAAEKIEDKFGKKKKKDITPKKDVTPIETTNTKGDQIVKELQKLSNSKNTPKSSNTISSQFDEILDM